MPFTYTLRRLLLGLGATLVLLGSTSGLAQTVGPSGLTDPDLFPQFAPLEQRSATANQAVYDQLRTPAVGCNNLSDGSGSGGDPGCTGQVFEVYENVRELVETANALNGTGPTGFSLGLDEENLGFALRWTAGEELAAQSTSVTQFVNSQQGNLASRIAALRFGARGRRTAGIDWNIDTMMASTEPAVASDSSGAASSIASRWGVFLDGTYGWGDQDDTTFIEGYSDAFAYDGQDVTLGVDYRVTENVVLGVLGAYTDKRVDFDPSASVVDGNIDSTGGSVIGYGLWETDRFYITGSVGGQWLSHDMDRVITYPSFNPLVPSTNETASGDTDSTALIASLGAGVDFRWGGFTVEPYLNAEYQDIDIDAFTETQAFGFDLRYDEQTIKSRTIGLGLKLQYVWTPSFGVVIPYIRGELQREFEDDARIINAAYLGVADLESSLGLSTEFAIPTDPVDDQYGVLAGGFSAVLPNGLQGYLQYQQVVSLRNLTEQVISGGLRIEF